MSETYTVFKLVEENERGELVSLSTPPELSVVYKRGEKVYPTEIAQKLGLWLTAFGSFSSADRFKEYIVPNARVFFAECEIVDTEFKLLSYQQLCFLARLIREGAPFRVLKNYLNEIEKHDLYPPPDKFTSDLIACRWIKLLRPVGFSLRRGGRI